MTDNRDVARVLAAIAETIGAKETWPPYPGGYPNEVEAALIDSVFSLRAIYGTSAGTGVRRLVQNWRTYVARPLNSLVRLVADVDDAGGPEVFKSNLGSAAVAVPNAKDKPTKAGAVFGTARTLVQFGLDGADDVRNANRDRPVELHRAITKERGLGDAAATYFLMLLHVPGIKADVMIRRFMARALGEESMSPERAKMLAAAAAVALDVDMLALDHAIWDRESRLTADMRRRRRFAVHGPASTC